LADVPDLVWRAIRKKDEGNHFADMDQEGKGQYAGKTLLDLCKDPKNVSVDVWNKFYDSLDVGYKRGALPFRVWQMYDAMVDYVKKGKIAEFVCTTGIMAHYVGDACQPLHVSHLHHGHNESEAGVHSEYETKMLDRFAPEIIAGVNSKLKNKKAKPTVKGGHEAAILVIELMRKTIQMLPPQDVIDAYKSQGSGSRIQRMWDALGDRTVECVANGCLELATLWASAWKEGGGSAVSQQVIAPVSRTKLKTLYNTSNFLPALRLKEMKNL